MGDLAKVIPCFTIYLAELHLNSRKNTEKGSLHDRMWPPVRDAVHLARVKGCKKRSRGAFGVRRWIYIYHRRHSAYLPPPVRKRSSGGEKITSSTIRGKIGFEGSWEYPSLRISFLRISIHANVGWPDSRWRNALWVHHCCLVGPSLLPCGSIIAPCQGALMQSSPSGGLMKPITKYDFFLSFYIRADLLNQMAAAKPKTEHSV